MESILKCRKFLGHSKYDLIIDKTSLPYSTRNQHSTKVCVTISKRKHHANFKVDYNFKVLCLI